MDITELVTAIDQRLAQAQAEIAQLQSARERLVNGAGPPRARRISRRAKLVRATSRAKASNSRPNTPKAHSKLNRARRTRVVPAESLEQILGEHDGLTTAQLAERANGKPDQVLVLLRELETKQRVRRTGQRRGTRWHRLTEEDLIAERAAELASRSKKAHT